jgi:hypothetical protein
MVEPAATYLDRLAKILSEYRATEKLAGARMFVLTKQQEGSPAVQERIRVPLQPEGPSAVSPIVPQPPAPSIESQEPQQGGSPAGKSGKKKPASRSDLKPPVAEGGSRNPEASKNSAGSRSSEGSRSPGGWYIKK